MSILKEFRDFAIKGNAIDMAVGIVIGSAFGKIVSSLVSDVIMPPIGKLLGNVNFSSLSLVLGGTATLNYGSFIQACVDFVIVAFAIFMMLKGINTLKRKRKEEPAIEAKPSEEVLLLRDIRDSLKKR